MSQMQIPTIGSQFVLSEMWTFSLHPERRNDKFWEKMLWLDGEKDPPIPSYSDQYDAARNGEDLSVKLSLPAETCLKVSRMYIRNGGAEYDSVTWTIVSHPTNKKVKGRFWVKLEDANTMQGSWKEETLKIATGGKR